MLVSRVVYTVRHVTDMCMAITSSTVFRWWRLSSTHGIGGTRNIVVYACPNTNRLVCENGGNCYTDTGHEDGYLDESTLVDDGSGDV